MTALDAELERWKSGGQYFDYLGFDVFYRVEGSGPTLLLIHGYPFKLVGLGTDVGQTDGSLHRCRTRHARYGVL